MISFGLTPGDFAASHFERKPYLQRRALEKPVLVWRDVDELLYRLEPHEPLTQLFNGGPIAGETYVDEAPEMGRLRRRINKHRFYQQLQAGATFVVNRMEDQLLLAKRLCVELSRFAAQPTTCNAYLSFGGLGTFGKHWDTHDVFAIQLLGRKRWQVFAPSFPLPLSHQTSRGREAQCRGEPVIDTVLESGDMLYVPRGWWHQVIPLASGSFHLSVGTYAPTLHDYVMWACAGKLAEMASARRALTTPAQSHELAAVLQECMTAIADPRAISAFLQDVRARERLVAEFNIAAALERGPETLPGTSTVMLNASYPIDTSHGEIQVNGRRVRLNPVDEAVLRVLAEHSPLTVECLCARLPSASPDAIRRALLELARYDLVTLF